MSLGCLLAIHGRATIGNDLPSTWGRHQTSEWSMVADRVLSTTLSLPFSTNEPLDNIGQLTISYFLVFSYIVFVLLLLVSTHIHYKQSQTITAEGSVVSSPKLLLIAFYGRMKFITAEIDFNWPRLDRSVALVLTLNINLIFADPSFGPSRSCLPISGRCSYLISFERIPK